MYSPQWGRWLQRDPIGEAGGLNLYGYCLNDPSDLIDTLGLTCCDLTLSIGHGHVPTSGEVFLNQSPKPNTNNSYFLQYGNQCTMYGGCGLNALNTGGVGDGVYPNNWNGGKHPSAGSLANGQDNAPEDYSLGSRAQTMMYALAKKRCKDGGCSKVKITIVTNPGTDNAFFNSLILPKSGKPLNGYTQSFDCSDPSMK